MEGIFFRRRKIYNFNAGKCRKKKQYVSFDENKKLKQKIVLSGWGNSAYYIASTNLQEFSPKAREQASKRNWFLSKLIKSIAESTGNNPDSIQEESITINNYPCRKFESDFQIEEKKGKKRAVKLIEQPKKFLQIWVQFFPVIV